MVLPRPLLIALAGVATLAVALFGMRALGSGEDEGTEPLPTAAEQRAPAKPAAAAGTLSSGRVRMKLSVEDLRGAPAPVAGGARLDLSGAFQGQGASLPPKFDLTLRASAANERYELGAVSLGDRGFVSAGGKTYAVPEQGWAALTDARAKLAGLAGASQGSADQPLSDLGAYVSGKKAVGAGQLDGVDVIHSRGSVDVRRLASDLERVAGGQGVAGQLPDGLAERLDEVVRSSRVDIWEGRDGIARRVRLNVALRVPASARADLEGLRSARISLAADFTGVNKPQRIAAPHKAVAAAGALSEDLVFGVALAGAGIMLVDPPAGVENVDPAAFASASGTPSAPAAQAAPVEAGEGVPGKVARALGAGRTVVLFFEQGAGGDDAATEESIRDIRRLRQRGIAVLSDSIDNLADYRRVVQDLGIAQAPAIVVIGPDRTARVLEGYTDSGTLAQAIRDAQAP